MEATMEIDEETLLSGLSSSESETNRFAAAFWEKAWPKLQENGWEKVVNPTAPEASASTVVVLATKKNLDVQISKMGEDYYVRIKDVIDRINERRNTVESSAADLYRRTISKPAKMPSPNFEPTFRRKRRKVAEQASPESNISNSNSSSPIKLDLSWKYSGAIFPKKSSRVGGEYQATSIPMATRVGKVAVQTSDTYCELIWDPKKAQEKGIVMEEGRDVVSGVAHNLREQALLGLAAVDYNVEAFQSTVDAGDLKPDDGSDWTQAQRDTFHAEIFRSRRDVPAVAKVMDLPVKVCHAYYLGTYKNSNEYRLLKTVGKEERESKEDEHDLCAICGDGGSLLICDGCEVEYHMTCMKPALAKVPEGYWECDDCVDRRLLEARTHLMQTSKLFEQVEEPIQKDGTLNHAGGASHRVVYRPVPSVLQAVQEMAHTVSQALSLSNPDGSDTVPGTAVALGGKD